MTATVHAPERAVARVDLNAVERNCAHLRTLLVGGAQLCAVVKANAYGHGDVWCARAAKRAGASWLAVATAVEAAELRRHGIGGQILVLGALSLADEAIALEAGADVVAWREGFASGLAERAAALGTRARVHVKLDTGMGRLGTSDPAEASAVADRVARDEHLELVGLMSHFATADEPGDEHFRIQLERFRAWVDETRTRHPRAIAHIANSAATYRERGSHFDLVRCGIAIYGLDPFQRDPDERGLEPALALESYVAAIKRFEPGQSAGYGRTWTAREPTLVGVVPIGYGDGWRRLLSGRADVLVRGSRRPLRGAVSMDNLTIDLGSDADVEEGDRVVLIGAQGGERILCEEVALRSDTINYEVTCALTPRVRRARVEP